MGLCERECFTIRSLFFVSVRLCCFAMVELGSCFHGRHACRSMFCSSSCVEDTEASYTILTPSFLQIIGQRVRNFVANGNMLIITGGIMAVEFINTYFFYNIEVCPECLEIRAHSPTVHDRVPSCSSNTDVCF